MTRIVAGTAGGRTLQVPRRGTRPTSERVREALFSRLEHLGVVSGARVLDLYAGSGALGLEAASRGAVAVTLVESSRDAAEVCRRNVATLGLRGVTVAAERAEKFVQRRPVTPWDLVLVDPPYDVAEADLAAVLAGVARGVAHDGVLAVERSSRSPEPTWPAGWDGVERRVYGETVVWFGERATAENLPGDAAQPDDDVGARDTAGRPGPGPDED
ncbi:16S rRNA (guanine(966)-N(2))-methyltransferase RsmD [Cellulomonas fimi]|uniref:16S rRNA (guanine(966)-N(2))-methyltransferase RsmD n=1 Tax=Cellulomonas fimi TaxID=1708 RepID=UPI00234C07BC|nr:16S rRNA (guanine(966)-N(2))-methyltransferase RsmD [Cellulomonas fimi]MDC7121158.1 16S rRNA (guanine(966)-N(2))-methyltransferase RsmD [Cellulomonas fimi]